MLRTVGCFIWLVFALLARIPLMMKYKKAEQFPPEVYAAEVHQVAHRWACALAKKLGMRMHVNGLEQIPDAPVLFVSNHQSDVDIVAILACLSQPVGFVAKNELLKVPLLRTWMAYMRSVFMNRKDIRQAAKTILEGIEILKSGHSLVLFPEGTRAKTSEMLPFKAGSFKLATKAKVPIVPVTIDGTRKVLEGSRYRVTPSDVYITFHAPLPTEGLEAEALSALPAQVADVIRAGLTA